MAWATTSRQSRGYGAAWDRLRKQILERDSYICQPCKRRAKIVIGNQVDHIKPKAQGGTDSEGNLEAICNDCHKAKTAQDNGKVYRSKPRIGSDGWPL